MKVPKVKKRAVSLHSRAARRADSPSLNVDKSLSSLKPPAESSDYTPKILGAQNAGITKKKKAKPMTRQQRLRQQKGLERADRNIDRLETKVEKSKVKEKRTKDRAAAWEDLNEKVKKSTATETGATAAPEDLDSTEPAPVIATKSAVPGNDEVIHMPGEGSTSKAPTEVDEDNEIDVVL